MDSDSVEAGLADGSILGVEFTQKTESNGVFATLPAGVADRLRSSFRFYDWGPASGGSEQRDSDASRGGREDAARGEVRWMCSWDTTEDDIDGFVAAIVEALART